MQIERLFKIIYRLLSGDRVTAKQLADMLEVSVRTIYRDIDTLTLAGIPIYAESRRGGGYSLMEEFLLPSILLSEQEREHIIIALQNLASTGDQSIQNTLSKINALFQKQATSWIEVEYSGWGDNDNQQKKFDTIKQSILSHQRILFTYINVSNHMSQRVVEPLKLLFKSRDWYLHAYCCEKRQYRLFKLRRIIDIKPKEEIYDVQPHLSFSNPLEEKTEFKFPTLILRFHPSVKYRLFDEFSIEHINEDSEGYSIVKVSLPEDDWLYSFLLSFGGLAQVIEPSSIKQRYNKKIKKLISLSNID